MATIIGWDIGGVHVKVAVIKDGRVTAVEQFPCTLWLGVNHLRDAIDTVVARYGQADRHAITMTGELAENFASREDGVRAICEEASAILGEEKVLFYAPQFQIGPYGFARKEAAVFAWQRVASANWHASAAWAVTQRPDALFIDIGSTTTDIIALRNGAVGANGYSDASRLEFGELIYSGVMRTSLMVLAAEAPFGGIKQRLMAENFSTTADIYRLTGELNPEDDCYPASDGRGKSAAECRARLARMFGRDTGDTPPEVWNDIARNFRERQLQIITDGVAQVLSDRYMSRSAPFVAAGAGHFLVPELARRFGHPCERLADLFPVTEDVKRRAGVCAPAVAAGLLAARGQGAERVTQR